MIYRSETVTIEGWNLFPEEKYRVRKMNLKNSRSRSLGEKMIEFFNFRFAPQEAVGLESNVSLTLEARDAYPILQVYSGSVSCIR